MATPNNIRTKIKDRVRRLTLVELLLIALLLSSVLNGSRLSDIDSALQRIDEVRSAVTSTSDDVVSKLDDLKDVLEQIAANQ